MVSHSWFLKFYLTSLTATYDMIASIIQEKRNFVGSLFFKSVIHTKKLAFFLYIYSAFKHRFLLLSYGYKNFNLMYVYVSAHQYIHWYFWCIFFFRGKKSFVEFLFLKLIMHTHTHTKKNRKGKRIGIIFYNFDGYALIVSVQIYVSKFLLDFR